jgi:hypothetical protein
MSTNSKYVLALAKYPARLVRKFPDSPTFIATRTCTVVRFRGSPNVYSRWIFLLIYTHFYPESVVFSFL